MSLPATKYWVEKFMKHIRCRKKLAIRKLYGIYTHNNDSDDEQHCTFLLFIYVYLCEKKMFTRIDKEEGKII